MSTPNGLPNAAPLANSNSQLPNVSPDKLKAVLQGMLDEFVEKMTRSVNEARYGHLIDDSEEPVRQAGHEFLRAAFEAALQQKIDAAEASFSPSGDDSDRPCHPAAGDQANEQQGATGTTGIDGCRPGEGGSPLVLRPASGEPGSGGSGDRSGDGDDHCRRA